MRLRMKLRLGLAALLALVFVVLVIYLFAVPRIPTGYDEIARLRQADLQAETEAPSAAPAPSRVTRTTSPHASGPAAPRTSSPLSSSPPSVPETSRQKFQRCWAAVENYSRDHWTPTHKKAYGSLYDLMNDADRSAWPDVFSVSLTPGEGEELGRLTSNTLAFGQAVRRIVDPKFASMKPLSRPQLIYGDQSSYLSPGELAAKIAQSVSVPPLPEAAELLNLPAGAVPTLPVPLDQVHGGGLFPCLLQAYLYALAHDLSFDAAAGFQRLRALQHYLRLALYPTGPSYEEGRTLETLLHALLFSRQIAARQKAAVAHEFARLSLTEREWIASNGDRIRRHQAERIYQDLTGEFESYLGGAQFNNNAFHFFLNGKPEQLWMTANAGNIRRHIELYAVAVARGTRAEQQSALQSLRSLLRFVNVNPKADAADAINTYLGNRPDPLIPTLYDPSKPLALYALKAYWLAQRRLPSSLSDLIPDYLSEAPTEPGSVSWPTQVGGIPALVKATAAALSHPDELQRAAHDPKKFRALALQQYDEFVRKNGKRPDNSPTDAIIEKHRQFYLERPVIYSLRIDAIPLDFALPLPPPAPTQ